MVVLLVGFGFRTVQFCTLSTMPQRISAAATKGEFRCPSYPEDRKFLPCKRASRPEVNPFLNVLLRCRNDQFIPYLTTFCPSRFYRSNYGISTYLFSYALPFWFVHWLVGLLVCNPAGLRSPILNNFRTCQHPDVWVCYKLFLAFLVIIDSLDFVYFLPCIVQPCNIAGFQLLQYTNIRARSNGHDRLPAPLMY